MSQALLFFTLLYEEAPIPLHPKEAREDPEAPDSKGRFRFRYESLSVTEERDRVLHTWRLLEGATNRLALRHTPRGKRRTVQEEAHIPRKDPLTTSCGATMIVA